MPRKFKRAKKPVGIVIGFFVKSVTVGKPSEDGKRISPIYTARSAAEQFAKEAMKTGDYTHTWVADKIGKER